MNLEPCTYAEPAEIIPAEPRTKDYGGREISAELQDVEREQNERSAAAETLARRTAHAELLAQARKWTPPAGHATWCKTQREPWEGWDRHSTGIGDGAYKSESARECVCHKSPTARAVAARVRRDSGEGKAPRKARASLSVVPVAVAPVSRVAIIAATGPDPEPVPASEPETSSPLDLEGWGARIRALESELDSARYDQRAAWKRALSEGMSMAEIGRRSGLSRERVRQTMIGR